MAENEQPYEVGYGRPPKGGQFTKGQSGNLKGRPKGSKNLSTVVLRESQQRVRVNGPNGSRMLTKLEAAVMQIGNKAAQGDFRAARELFALVQRSEEEIGSGARVENFHEADQRLLENLRRRFNNFNAVATPNSGETSK